MPLTVIRNIETPREGFDKHVMSGGLRVGRIYKREAAAKPELQFLWAINGVFGGPDGMRVAGMAATFDQAQAELKENWEKWLAWAKLQEIGAPTPPQPPAAPPDSPDSST
jgi:hypothetical protein